MARAHVYLIPGFFGFANFGDFKYFTHVREVLAAAFAERGVEPTIHYAPTYPTSSLRRRAARLLQVVHETAADDDGAIYLIGHSTGGLDARLLLTPNADLGSSLDREALAARVSSVVTVSSPHFGTPVAGFFTSVLGQRILQVLSVTTIHGVRLGSMPLPALVAIVEAIRGEPRSAAAGALDQIYRQVLRDFRPDRRKEIERFFGEVVTDQALLPQLSPFGMDLFNAAVADRPGVRYGCVVTRARPPRLLDTAKAGVSASGQAMLALYRTLHALCAGMSPDFLPTLSSEQTTALKDAYDDVPSTESNDAIVPTRSQVWGELVYATWADHLDAIGHFDEPSHDPPHVDWLKTYCRFRRPQFEQLWTRVVDFAVGDA